MRDDGVSCANGMRNGTSTLTSVSIKKLFVSPTAARVVVTRWWRITAHIAPNTERDPLESHILHQDRKTFFSKIEWCFHVWLSENRTANWWMAVKGLLRRGIFQTSINLEALKCSQTCLNEGIFNPQKGYRSVRLLRILRSLNFRTHIKAIAPLIQGFILRPSTGINDSNSKLPERT